ncbi:hypothetical protein Q9189_007172, partial [Teloschistes chrysophthalmus]
MTGDIMTDLEGNEWTEVDRNIMHEVQAQRVPHTENLTYGELTDLDAPGESDSFTAGFTEERTPQPDVLQDFQSTFGPVPEGTEELVNPEQAAVDAPRSMWEFNPEAAREEYEDHPLPRQQLYHRSYGLIPESIEEPVNPEQEALNARRSRWGLPAEARSAEYEDHPLPRQQTYRRSYAPIPESNEESVNPGQEALNARRSRWGLQAEVRREQYEDPYYPRRPMYQRSFEHASERTEEPIDHEQAALEARRSRWGLQPAAEDQGWEYQESPLTRRPVHRGQEGRQPFHQPVPLPSRERGFIHPSAYASRPPLSYSEEEEEDQPINAQQLERQQARRSFAGSEASPAPLAAPTNKRPSTKAEQNQARARAADLQADLDSKWRDMKEIRNMKANIEKHTKIANGGNIGSPTPSPPPLPKRGKGGRPRKVRAPTPPTRFCLPSDMNPAGYTPGQKEQEEKKRKRLRPVSDLKGHIIGYRTPSPEPERDEEGPPSKRGRGGPRGRP